MPASAALPKRDPLLDRVIAALGDQYLVEAEIGRGGMAVVYRALDLKLNRHVALKVLPPELAFNGDVRTRFLREAQMAAQLSHPNIVPIYSVDERDGVVFFAMGLVTGESLGSLLAREPRRPIAEVRRLLGDVADALAYAHEHGVVHRDIKPDNILIDAHGRRPMVTDFGIARAAAESSRLTVTGMAVGTPTYMSPEQALGEREIDGRSDIYSLGIVAYQMLCGDPPFRATSTPAMLVKHVSEAPRPIAEIRQDAPSQLADAVARALAKSPEARWPDAAAFRDALRDETRARSEGMAQQAPADPAHAMSPPPFPVGYDRDSEERRAWREAKRAWKAQLQASRGRAASHAQTAPRGLEERWRMAPFPPLPPLAPPADFSAMTPMGWRGARRGGEKPLRKQVSTFRGHLWSNSATIVGLWAINLTTSPSFLWAVFPTIGMAVGIFGHAARVRANGASFGQLFGNASLPAEEPEHYLASAHPSAPLTLKGVPGEVFAGAHGPAVRRAAEDRAAILDVVAKLGKEDREMLPDVAPTVEALAERVGVLATTLHRLEGDVSGTALGQLDERIATLEARANRSSEEERRLALLTRQRATLSDLLSRRDGLASQLESAGLALQNLKLDLLKLRSSGLSATISDVNSATQEARAVSRDIARALDIADEVRRI